MSKSDTLLSYLFTDISNYNVTGAIAEVLGNIFDSQLSFPKV